MAVRIAAVDWSILGSWVAEDESPSGSKVRAAAIQDSVCTATEAGEE